MRDYSRLDRWTKTHIGHYQKKQRWVIWDVAVGYPVRATLRGKRILEVFVKYLDGKRVRR